MYPSFDVLFSQGTNHLLDMSAHKNADQCSTVAGLILIVVVLMTFTTEEMYLCSLARNCAVKKRCQKLSAMSRQAP